MRISDALEKPPGGHDLEDADFELPRGLFVRFPFATAHRDIIAIGDDIEKAAS